MGKAMRWSCLPWFVVVTACGAAAKTESNAEVGVGGDSAGTSAPSAAGAGAGATSGGGASVGAAGSEVTGGSGGGAGARLGGDGGGSSGHGPPLPGCTQAPVDAAPSAAWVNATGNLANMASACGTLGKVAAKPCSDTVIAAVVEQGIWSSSDRGRTWNALGTGAGSVQMKNHAFSLFFDPDHPEVIWETGLHDGSGAYTSRDGGLTFVRLGTMTESQLIGVDFQDPARKTLVVGSHGQHQAVYLSTNAGLTWTNIGLNLPAETSNSESPVVIDAKTYVIGVCNSSEQGCGFYRTTDSGATWAKTSELEASHFGAPLHASDGTIYWPIQLDRGFGKSTDQGETWTNVAAPGMIVGITPIELPDASIVVVGPDHLLRSADHGGSFTPIGEPLPYSLSINQSGSVTYSAMTKTFYLSHWECSTSVAPNAIMSAGYDYTK